MQKKQTPQFRLGFTLIEILVVISIIGILAAIGLASYVTVQEKARDSRRKSDVQSIASALEQYFSDNNAYPTASKLVPNLQGYLSGIDYLKIEKSNPKLSHLGKHFKAIVPKVWAAPLPIPGGTDCPLPPGSTSLSTYFSGPTPVDPKTGLAYSCVVADTQDAFCVCALLEAGGGNADAPDRGDGTCVYTDSGNGTFGDYFCRSNSQ